MSGPRDHEQDWNRPPESPSQSSWPERDLREVRAVEVADADPITRADDTAWDPLRFGERRRPTTAEQAVPWLIGIILALAGIVIVLMALIFTSENGRLAGAPNGSPDAGGVATAASSNPSGSAATSATPSPSSTPSPSAATSATPAASAPRPFGPLEMVYLGRKTADAPVYLFRRDFTKKVDASELARAAQGITNYAWSPDGKVGAVIIAGRVVAIDANGSKRALYDGADEITFGSDASTLYAARLTGSGGSDRAQVFAVNFANGKARRLSDLTYPHQAIVKESALKEAAFTDEGGTVRLYPTADGNLVLWILGAPGIYRIDPVDGSRVQVTRIPVLWSPDGNRRVEAKASGSSTTLRLLDQANQPKASVTVKGVVSHPRWATDGSEISFTLGRLSANGRVRQDLFVWDLVNAKQPVALTSGGAAFGAQWLAAPQSWQP